MRAAAVDAPEQVHLSFGQNTREVVVMWVTANKSASTVRFGSDANNFSMSADGEIWQFVGDGNSAGKQWYHRVRLQVG